MSDKSFKEFLVDERDRALMAGNVRAFFIFSRYLERYEEQEKKMFGERCDIETCNQYCGVENCPGRD